MLNQLRLIKYKAQTMLTYQRIRHLYTQPHQNLELEQHVQAALNWLKRAQDHDHDRGVSYGTQIGQGFLSSYPETTGYIIPTFLRLARLNDDADLRQRAIEMGEWECDIQMECGAVMGGRVDIEPTPALFNTGQVLFGWNQLYAETQQAIFRDAGLRAAHWMVQTQHDSGNWIEGNSHYAITEGTLYNVRAAWALAAFGQHVDQKQFVEAALRNADYVVQQQYPNGWFPNCSLASVNRPITHTIAYTTRGLLEIGLLNQRQQYIDTAIKTADQLLHLLHDDGFLAGVFNQHWQAITDWSCVTGSCQTAIIWAKLYNITGSQKYLDGVNRITDYVMQRHDLDSPDLTVRGGIPGSWPISGPYGQFKILNWATKFFIDALLERQQIESKPHA